MEKKMDAVAEAQRQREFYFKEKILLCKVLNIPKTIVPEETSEEKK
jgi:hypothetical protein